MLVLPAALLPVPVFAQQTPPAWCIPGTPLCATGNGQGGVKVGGTAAGQASPQGASGQATGTATAYGNGNGQATARPPANAPPPRQSPPATTTPWAPPRQTPPPVYSQPRQRYSGPPASAGGNVCGVGRYGFSSGFKFGGCLGFSFYGRTVGFDIDVNMLGGGNVETFDILLNPSLVVALAGPDYENYGNFYLRFGATMLGVSVPVGATPGTTALRMGGLAGLGYNIALSDHVALRVVDAAFYAEGQLGNGNPAPMDRDGHRYDLGLQFSTGFIFH